MRKARHDEVPVRVIFVLHCAFVQLLVSALKLKLRLRTQLEPAFTLAPKLAILLDDPIEISAFLL